MTNFDDENIKYRSKRKDRKRWCRGKVGVEHDPHWVLYDDLKHYNSPWAKDRQWRVNVCKNCGKELEHKFRWDYIIKCAICKRMPMPPPGRHYFWRGTEQTPGPGWHCACTDKDVKSIIFQMTLD